MNKKSFDIVNPKIDFVMMEKDILKWWENNNIVKKYMLKNDDSSQRFSFIDGPITANNPMGVHHGWGRTYKDLFQRFKTMQGFKQRYQNGFDGQGLWIEVEVEKELGLNSKREIEKFGIDKFVNLCKERVLRFAEIQTNQSIRLAYWMDWDNSYHTMSDENNYTIWHFLKVCYENGWIYEGTDVMPWCPRCGTGLSQHEIVTEGYQEIVHPGLYVKFPIIDKENESLLIWTTTPWTLTSNTFAYVHPDLMYSKVETEDKEIFYLMSSRLGELEGKYRILSEIPGRSLEGIKYHGPFDELPIQQGVAHTVVTSDTVSESEGTGIVHAAPGAGEEDFKISKSRGITVIAPLDESGIFVDGFDWLTGKSVFEVNELIYKSLKQKGIFYRLEKYKHRYPVCWRCNTELIFRLVNEWFISMDALRSQIAKVTQKANWVPGFGLQRELDWLSNMDDWMISKKRYWGLALPIFKCDCGHFDVIGSEQELEKRAVEGWGKLKGQSPHRPWIDSIKIECEKCGKKVSRILDVGNPWLDAGIVPFSTLGYRNDHDYWKDWFPADLISESFPGQFRNWFYSLLTMSTVLENSEPFRAVFSYALMRDENGDEMHKSKGNAIWFEDAADQMGVDAMRWVYINHNPAANLNFGLGIADESRRRFIIPLWNVYSFFVTYANIDEFNPALTNSIPLEDRPELDRWITSELNELIIAVTESLEKYDPANACRKMEQFVEFLSNWYVRRSRRRFWKSGTAGPNQGNVDKDKLAAYNTLYDCLTTLTKLLAPFLPYTTESMYQNLVRSFGIGQESVHLESYPVPDLYCIDTNLSASTRLGMRICSIGRAARSQAGIKVRQPLQKLYIALPTLEEKDDLEIITPQILEELNVKKLSVVKDEMDFSTRSVQLNMSSVGPKFGNKLNDLKEALLKEDPEDIFQQTRKCPYKNDSELDPNCKILIGSFELSPGDINFISIDKPSLSVSRDAGYTVAITTAIGSELASEGMARELVHKIQNMRRSAGFDIADQITTYYKCDAQLKDVISAHNDYLRQETLSLELIEGDPPESSYLESHQLDGLSITLAVKR